MRHDEARLHALKAALEVRASGMTPAAVIEQAKQFEAYIAADGRDTAQAPLSIGAQATQETASAARSTRR